MLFETSDHHSCFPSCSVPCLHAHKQRKWIHCFCLPLFSVWINQKMFTSADQTCSKQIFKPHRSPQGFLLLCFCSSAAVSVVSSFGTVTYQNCSYFPLIAGNKPVMIMWKMKGLNNSSGIPKLCMKIYFFLQVSHKGASLLLGPLIKCGFSFLFCWSAFVFNVLSRFWMLSSIIHTELLNASNGVIYQYLVTRKHEMCVCVLHVTFTLSSSCLNKSNGWCIFFKVKQ